MFRIAICDDELDQCQSTHRLLDEYISLRGITAKATSFTASQDLLNAAYDNLFDIYLLDVVMPDINGINLGIELRKIDSNGVIIYTTTSPDFALESFNARASSYILKPLGKEALFSALDDALHARQRRREAGITVRTQDSTVRVLLDNILYVELKSRAPHYYQKNGSCLSGLTLQTSFQEAMQPLLEVKNFFLCGASFVLNLHYIESISKTFVQFQDGQQVQIPKRVHSALYTAWSNYWLEGGRD